MVCKHLLVFVLIICCAIIVEEKWRFCVAHAWFFVAYIGSPYCLVAGCTQFLVIAHGCCCDIMCACMLRLSKSFVLIYRIKFNVKCHGVHFGDFSHNHVIIQNMLFYIIRFGEPPPICMVMKSNPTYFIAPLKQKILPARLLCDLQTCKNAMKQIHVKASIYQSFHIFAV